MKRYIVCMRCFIAIDISNEIKDKLLDIQEEVSKTGKYNFVGRDAMHLTAKFLGDVTNVEEIQNKLRSIRFTSFDMSIEGLGFFQNNGNPTVIWSSVKTENNLELLNEIINDTLGTTEDRKYSPHLTLARVKECNKSALFEVLKKYNSVKLGEVHVKEFTLYKSTLTPEGPVYEVIETYQLPSI